MKSRSLRIVSLVCLAAIVVINLNQFAPMRAQGEATSAPVATVPPTNTPRPTYTLVPTATAAPTALPAAIPGRLCANCSRVRLRATAGTAGNVLDFLDSSSVIVIQGRSADSNWIQVKVNSTGIVGWIAVQFVRSNAGDALDEATLNNLPIRGVAVEASPTPTGVPGSVNSAGIPSWLSGITGHSREIFLKGQSLGNRANVFSRVGDSISASPYFLYPIGRGEYDLGAYSYLSGVINYFSQADARQGNSFVNPPLAAQGSWSAFNMLQKHDNTPTCGFDAYLVCEYKLVKPAVALIMIGTNDSGSGSTGPFEGNLRQIVQISIDHGVIPVLSTIPPRRVNADQIARVAAFNDVIRSIAQQYDIPLWDYFSVMDNAPNGGIGTDGLHPSIPPDGATGRFTPDNLQYGYTIRNLMALQVLDSLWRNVLS